MEVAADAVFVPAYDQAHLRVDFVTDQSIDNVDAGFLQLTRPLDVVGFVKARAQFHHGGDLFSVLNGVHQGAHDARIAAGAVKRLLDGQHSGIRRRLLQKFDHAVEGS